MGRRDKGPPSPPSSLPRGCLRRLGSQMLPVRSHSSVSNNQELTVSLGLRGVGSFQRVVYTRAI